MTRDGRQEAGVYSLAKPMASSNVVPLPPKHLLAEQGIYVLQRLYKASHATPASSGFCLQTCPIFLGLTVDMKEALNIAFSVYPQLPPPQTPPPTKPPPLPTLHGMQRSAPKKGRRPVRILEVRVDEPPIKLSTDMPGSQITFPEARRAEECHFKPRI